MLCDITKIWILYFRRTSAYNKRIPDTAHMKSRTGDS